MSNFIDDARKIMNNIEVLAQRIDNDNNIKEYFMEAFGYLDGDDPTPAMLAYIQSELLC